MLRTLFLTLALVVSVSAQAGQLLKPDPKITYGDLCSDKDPDYVDVRYSEKVPYCVRNVTWEQKVKIYETYGVPAKCRKYYTIDHFIPLALGGSNQLVNLWPEHRYVKATRRFLEQQLFDQLRRGEVSQQAAMDVIVNAKMNPATPKPWKCGISTGSNGMDVGTSEYQDQN